MTTFTGLSVTTAVYASDYYVQTCATTPNYKPSTTGIPFTDGSRIDGVVNTDRLVEEGDDTKVPSYRLYKENQSEIYQGMSELETEIQDSLQEAKDYTDQVGMDVTNNLQTEIQAAIDTCNLEAAELANTAETNANTYALNLNSNTLVYFNNEIDSITGEMIEEDTYDYASGCTYYIIDSSTCYFAIRKGDYTGTLQGLIVPRKTVRFTDGVIRRCVRSLYKEEALGTILTSRTNFSGRPIICIPQYIQELSSAVFQDDLNYRNPDIDRLAIHPFVKLVEGSDTAAYDIYESGLEYASDGGKYWYVPFVNNLYFSLMSNTFSQFYNCMLLYNEGDFTCRIWLVASPLADIDIMGNNIGGNLNTNVKGEVINCTRIPDDDINALFTYDITIINVTAPSATGNDMSRLYETFNTMMNKLLYS